jgi:magnesium-protoporphyrin O-methyltransferase
VGGLLIELLHGGASSGIGIDISQGMIEEAGLLARDKGVATNVRFKTGDYGVMKDDGIGADIVIMDKVLCCSSDPGSLIARASGAEKLAVSYPRDAFLARSSFTLMNFLGRLLRWSFYPFYHDPHSLDQLLAATGFHEIRRSATPFWQIVILKRD